MNRRSRAIVPALLFLVGCASGKAPESMTVAPATESDAGATAPDGSADITVDAGPSDCGAGLARRGDLCVDVDECASGISGCAQTCSNAVGSYWA